MTRPRRSRHALALLALAPCGLVTPAAAQVSQAALRFYGAGVDQQDRVRIAIDDNATGPDASAPCDVGAGSFTVEAWVRGTLADNGSSNSGGDQSFSDNRWISGNMLLDRDHWGTSARDWGISIAGGLVRFGTGAGDPPLVDSENTIEGDTLVLDGAWHHVVCVRDAVTGTKSLYVDGVLDFASPPGTSTADLSFPDDGDPSPVTPWNPYIVLAAEKHDAGPGYPSLTGYLDELRLWSVARSAAEIASSWNRLVPADSVGLVAAYRFEESAGTAVADASDAGSPPGELIAGQPGNGEWVTWAADPQDTAPLLGGSGVLVTFGTLPAGLPLRVDGLVRTTPFAFFSQEGAVHTVQAELTAVSGSTAWSFRRWSDGRRELARSFVVPSGGGALDARFQSFPTNASTLVVPAADRNADHHPPEGQQPANAYDAFGLCCGRDSGGAYQIGLKFPLPVPREATVFAAWLEVTASNDQQAAPTAFVRAYDVPDAPPFAFGSGGPLTRYAPLGSTLVSWTPSPFTPGQVHASPDLAMLLQPVVDRADWTAGNHVGLVLDGTPTTGDAWRCVRNVASGEPPRLRVVWGYPDVTVKTSASR